MEQIKFGRKETLEDTANLFFRYLEEKGHLAKIRDSLKGSKKGDKASLRRWLSQSEVRLKQLITLPLHDLIALDLPTCTNWKLIERVFDYSSFRSKWAFEFYNRYMDVPVCPYCNFHHTATLPDEKDGKLIFTLDHFLPKSKYPYFSLSFFNLIPSCHPCNQMFKGRKEASLESNMNPYLDDFHSSFRFKTMVKQDLVSQCINLDARESVPDLVKVKGEGNIEMFRLRELYQTVAYKGEEMSRLRQSHPESYFQSVATAFPELYPLGLDDVRRVIFGTSFISGEISQRPLGKLIYDLYEQLWESNL